MFTGFITPVAVGQKGHSVITAYGSLLPFAVPPSPHQLASAFAKSVARSILILSEPGVSDRPE